ncbi:hypothetical protein EU803_00580 [Loktanella sp. IMCC34160]|uniref:hypothetical protein n=1 Tax=Loktanella sp. IMCC34160 TaxID=2510646 RepID=UPI00101C2614|nr:hypothetical protein [Loktanella sp. IMCC34160]RYG92634.1 hypothetical protein EU803_00580 [Loktanella sp. IMCC34160]
MDDQSHHNALTPPARQTSAQPAVRNRQISEQLRDASRKLAMQSGSRRGIYSALGLAPRRRDRAFRLLYRLAFVMCFLAPLAGGLGYLYYFLSPQYETETRFVLRSALPAFPNADAPNDANVASLKVVQDTLVVVSFLESPGLVKRLNEEVNLERIYGGAEVDPLSRMRLGASPEDMAEYFEKFITTEVSSVSGIVTVKLRAFRPEDASEVLEIIFSLAEERVNLLNGTIWASVLEVAERNFDEASVQLREVRQRYAALQNETGVFDVELEAKVLSEVITALRTELIDLENRRATLLLEVPETHLNVVRFNRAIEVRTAQLEQLKDELASSRGSAATLSINQQRFDALRVELEIAQDRFKTAATELEQAKLLNSVQMVFLDRFIFPTVPQGSSYPIYAWEVVRLLFFCLSTWGLAFLALSWLQRRVD